MKRKILIAAWLIAIAPFFPATTSLAQTPNWLWAFSAGGGEYEFAESIAADASGNIYAVGYFESAAITFGATTLTNASALSGDMYIVKYDANGNVIWANSAGGIDVEEALSVAVDAAGNSYVTGIYSSSTITFGATTLTSAGGDEMFLAKYDAGGNVLWAASAGGSSSEIPYSVSVDDSGNSYVAGTFESSSITFGATTLTNAGSVDLFVVKYDAGGNAIWATSAGGSSSDRARSITADASGNSYVAGHFDGANITFGSTTLTNAGAGSDDMFLVKYDGNGNVLWAESAGASDYEEGRSVALDASGNSYVAGTFSSATITFGSTTLTNAGSYDMFVVKYDENGNVLWAKSEGGSDFDVVRSLTADVSGNSYVTGYFRSSTITFGATTLNNAVSGDDDIFIVKYDDAGNAVWAKSAGESTSDRAHAVDTDGSGNTYVGGYFDSPTITFGTTTLTNAASGSYDMFIAKLDNATGVISIGNHETVSIYPNPSNGIFTLDSKLINEEIIIYDFLGQTIYESELSLGRQEFRIDLSSQQKGIYMLTINDGEKIYSGKIVIE